MNVKDQQTSCTIFFLVFICLFYFNKYFDVSYNTSINFDLIKYTKKRLNGCN